ncbi:MAG: hypothetical protein P8J63_01285, partial [Verrucomicrobiota bacterium]|nr:hypothetical protein [Verrucomicrobiota bacterium]
MRSRDALTSLALRPATFILRAVLDIKYIRQEPDAAKERLIARGEDASRIDELLALDEQRRALVTEAETLQAARNAVSKEIGALMGQGKKEEAEAKKTETRELGSKVDSFNAQRTEVDGAFNNLILTLPNLAHESVPIGD